MSDSIQRHQIVERLWTEPAFEQCRPFLPRPADSNVLSAESRAGFVPMKWIEELPDSTRIMALDSSGSMLDAARQRIGEELQRRIFFVQQRIGSLSYADGVFQAAVCCHGLITARQAREGIGELTRVTVPGGQIAVCLPLGSSFDEFYDILDEALRSHGLHDVLQRAQEMRDSLVSTARLHDIGQRAGLLDVKVRELSWEVEFASGHDFLNSPLIQETFFPHWSGVVRASEREQVLHYIGDAINTYWHDRKLTSRVYAGFLSGVRA